MQYHASTYAEGVWDTYWFEKNLQGDVVAVFTMSGVRLIAYEYDAWGNSTVTYHNGGASTTAVNNPFRYRGYYYDSDLGFYYLNSRYYDPNTGRFISPDTSAVLTATPTALTDKNLYAYCDNNPVMRRDGDGAFWDTVFDLVTLVASVAEVCINPADPWAWIGLAGDIVDLIPVISGTGEAAKALGAANKAKNLVENADDINDVRKTINLMAEMAETGDDGFRTFRTAKKHLANAGDNVDWHHFVEQCQNARSGFSRTSINNTTNLVGIDRSLHHKISAFYSRKPDFVKNTTARTVRDWISGFNFQQQYTFGVFVFQLMKYK